MESVSQLIHAKWLITCEDKNNILENYAIAIQDNKIKDILPSKEATQLYAAKQTENYTSHALIPGLINAHTHIPMNYFRGLADDLKLMDWLNNHIWPAEKRWLSPEFVYDASLFAMAEMLRSGTTCFNDMYFFMPDIAKAAEVSGMRAHIGATLIGFPNKWANNVEEEFAKGIAFIEAYKNHDKIIPTIAPHAMYTLSEDKDLLRVKDIAEKYNLKINLHVQEAHSEIDTIIKKSGLRPWQRLQKLGLASPRLIAIHVLHSSEEDLEIIQTCKPNIVHCPESNMKLASGVCKVHELQKRGVNVALGTDGAASNNDLDMIGEMRTASFMSKHETPDSTSLPAAAALKMATLNGAKALGIDHLTGSLTVGKSADFAVIQLDEIETLPLYHPLSQIVYAASRRQVTDVWVAGKQLLKNRQLQTLDETELKAKARHWAEKIITS